MHTCREATRMVASDEYAEAGFWQRAKLRLHLWMCGTCREYVDQLRRIGDGARDVYADPENDPDVSERLRRAVVAGIRDREPGPDPSDTGDEGTTGAAPA